MFNSKDPQAIELCPYNPSHRILKYRMGKHIVKCRKAHQEENTMAVCLFNATHTVPASELEHHHANCEDRINLDKQAILPKDVDQLKFPIKTVDVTNEENWDDEDCPTYQPEEYCKNTMVLRQAKVESAATRKNFRVQERLRMQQLKDMEPTRTNGATTSQPSKFRSAALSNTITNVNEEEPNIIQRIIQTRDLKPIIVNPNQRPIFAGQSRTQAIPYDDEEKGESVEDSQGEDIPHMQSRDTKAAITNPNQKPIFVGKNKTASKPKENEESSDEGACGVTLLAALADLKINNENRPRGDDDGFIMQKSKKKIGRGRGRGVNH